MTLWPWLLGMDDIAGIVCIIAFLSLRDKNPSFTLFGVVIALVLVITNILMLIGYRNWFILAMPVIAIFIIAIFGRFLLKNNVGVMNPNLSKIVLLVALIFVIISVIIIFLIISTSKS